MNFLSVELCHSYAYKYDSLPEVSIHGFVVEEGHKHSRIVTFPTRGRKEKTITVLYQPFHLHNLLHVLLRHFTMPPYTLAKP